MRKLILAVCIFTSMAVCGCMTSSQLDDQCYVLSIGVDKGKEKKYNFTMQVPNVAKLGTEDNTAVGVVNISAEADSLYEAIITMNVSMAWRLNFSHANSFVISEELAREGDLINFMAPSLQSLDIRHTAALIVAKGESAKFLEGLGSDDDPNFAKLQENLSRESSFSGLYPKCIALQFVESYYCDYQDAVIPMGAFNQEVGEENKQKEDEKPVFGQEVGQIQREGGLASEMIGAAIFDENRMVGRLSGEETKYLLISRGDFNKGIINVKHGNASVNIFLKQLRKPKVSVDLDGPKINMTVYLEGQILPDVDTLKTSQIPDEIIFASAKAQILEKLNSLTGVSKQLHSDFIGVGKYAVKKFPTQQQWQEYDIKSRLSNMQIGWAVSLKFTGSVFDMESAKND